MNLLESIDIRLEKIAKVEDQLATLREELQNFMQIAVVGETIKMKNGLTGKVLSSSKTEGVFHLRVKWNDKTESYINIGEDEFTIEEDEEWG